MKKRLSIILAEVFFVPIVVLLGLIISLILRYVFLQIFFSDVLALATVIFGSFELVVETVSSLLKRKFALDYIAILAICVGLVTGHFLVATVIVLMLSGGNALEKYGMEKAKESLTALTDRIPNSVTLIKVDGSFDTTEIGRIRVGQSILVRRGEVVPLDGTMVSPAGVFDESSLTGEAYPADRVYGSTVMSGVVNVGEAVILKVIKEDRDSTYRKIIRTVERVQKEKAPLVRLADKYSVFFTILTLFVAGTAFAFSHSLYRVLAVLVMATPCPLILATPIALMGGVNAAARKRIIVKRISALEVLSRVKALVFDKTGTITIGKPVVERIEVVSSYYDQNSVLEIASAIERNSLHPLAKAIVNHSEKLEVTRVVASFVDEKIGDGISATVNEKRYKISKYLEAKSMAFQLKEEGVVIANFYFADNIKEDATVIANKLRRFGFNLYLFTGDKMEQAKKSVESLDGNIEIRSDCSPKDKEDGINGLRKDYITAMVGDGINDATALASAHVGMVFASEENTAATEAADIVFLGGGLHPVLDVMTISRRTVAIALESILIGISLSIVGMIVASFGLIPPIAGAFIQEAIDVFVIINALRASRQ